MGKQIEPVVEDGASDWPTFAEKSKKLLQADKVACVFGCWTSRQPQGRAAGVRRPQGPAVLPGAVRGPGVFAQHLLHRRDHQPADCPRIEYLLKEKKTKFFLLGSDYVFPRTANRIIKAQLGASNITAVGEEYTPLGHTDYNTVITKIRAANPDIVFNSLNGDSNVAFFKQFKDAGFTAANMPTLSVSIAEEEVRGIGTDIMKDHLVAWNYYQTTKTPENKKFVAAYKAKYGANRVTDDPIEAGYIGVYLWALAVEKAQSTEVDKVRAAAGGISFAAPEGKVTINGKNQHISKTVRIGKIRADGLIDEISATPAPVEPDPYLETYPWGAEFVKEKKK